MRVAEDMMAQLYSESLEIKRSTDQGGGSADSWATRVGIESDYADDAQLWVGRMIP